MTHSLSFRTPSLIQLLLPLSIQAAIQSSEPEKSCDIMVEKIIYEFRYVKENEIFGIYLDHISQLFQHMGISIVGHFHVCDLAHRTGFALQQHACLMMPREEPSYPTHRPP